jgi:hypothetical protein
MLFHGILKRFAQLFDEIPMLFGKFTINLKA